jgi:hypothetical protein
MRDQFVPQGEARARWSSGGCGSGGACREIEPEALARLVRARKALPSGTDVTGEPERLAAEGIGHQQVFDMLRVLVIGFVERDDDAADAHDTVLAQILLVAPRDIGRRFTSSPLAVRAFWGSSEGGENRVLE